MTEFGRMTIRTHKIASIGADGIGPEVVEAGLEVLEALSKADGGFALDIQRFDWGSERYRRTGAFMPEDGLAQLRKSDAILFGPARAPDIPSPIPRGGLPLPICQGFDQYANIRPTCVLPGVRSPLRDLAPGGLDWLIVRENSEGEYSGNGGGPHRGLPQEVAKEVCIFSTRG